MRKKSGYYDNEISDIDLLQKFKLWEVIYIIFREFSLLTFLKALTKSINSNK